MADTWGDSWGTSWGTSWARAEAETEPNTAYQKLRGIRQGIEEDDEECIAIAAMMVGVQHVAR